MRSILITTLMAIFLLSSCTEEISSEVVACGVSNPLKELGWLRDLVKKADADTTGNYFGTIYLEHINDEDMFFVRMAMGSGGVYGYWYDCSGSVVALDAFPTMQRIIYTNMPVSP